MAVIIDYDDGRGNVSLDPPEHFVLIKYAQSYVDEEGDINVTIHYRDDSA